MHWAGIAIIRLLNQHRRFDVIDFSYHLLRVYRSEPVPTQINSKQSNGTDGQIVRICIISQINTWILASARYN